MLFGIDNLGCTCYINTTLQCLLCNDEFVKNLEGGTGTLSQCIKKLCKDQNNESAIQLFTQLKLSLGKYMNFSMQNDMHEFTILLLDELNKEHKVKSKKKAKTGNTCVDFLRKSWDLHHKEGKSWLTQYFYGQTLRQIKCTECAKLFHNAEVFISLELEMGCSIFEMLQNYFNGDTIHDWKCDNCNHVSQSVVRTIKLTKFPQILILTLKRFGWNSTKNNSRVDIPNTLIFPDNSHIYKNSLEYELYAVGSHMGSNSGGHYVANVKQDNVWKTIDDDVIYDANFDPKNAYVLFYKLKNT